MIAAEYFTYTGRDDDIIPHDVTRVRVHKSVKVIPRRAFYGRRNIKEVVCDVGVETIEEEAFFGCISLRRLIMPGVKVVSDGAFCGCKALRYVECGELEIIGRSAFGGCKSLRSIDLPSAQIVKLFAFDWCEALANTKHSIAAY
ncbi:hypothetical protein QTG54_014446 [Skeletonema marinoi]|uniref:Leucine-rich repeat domain-containing protein n=1 Tax=Skeletonema marinoi TaxID=267567 RepID=A0AAD8XX91_9STRA|nr:hypothetical protein QTG54_014446 [Skeletonema marinoi]